MCRLPKTEERFIKIPQLSKNIIKNISVHFTFVNTSIIIMISSSSCTNLQSELLLPNEVLGVEMRWSIRYTKNCGKSVESVSTLSNRIGQFILHLALFGVIKVLCEPSSIWTTSPAKSLVTSSGLESSLKCTSPVQLFS